MSETQTAPPEFFQRFMEKFPAVHRKYEELGQEVHEGGPLDEKTRAFIKLAISGSSGLESAFRAHLRKARKLGITKEEAEHLCLLFLPTKGFPNTMKALYIIENEYK